MVIRLVKNIQEENNLKKTAFYTFFMIKISGGYFRFHKVNDKK